MRRMYLVCGFVMLWGLCGLAGLQARACAAASPTVTLTVTQTPYPIVNSVIKLTATVQNVSNAKYEFWVQSVSSIPTGWVLIRAKRSTSSCLWLTNAEGQYRFMVVVSGGNPDRMRCLAVSNAITVLGTPPVDVSIQLTPATLIQQTPVTITATSSSTTALQYSFAILDGAQTTWQVLQPFGAAATCPWTPAHEGPYTVMVLARAAGQTDAVATATLSCTVGAVDTAGLVSVTPYRGGRTAAISYSFDDGMICQTDVIAPMFTEAGFNATFYIVTSWIMENNDFTNPAGPGDWTGWRRVSAAGHEVGNHSYSHENLLGFTGEALQQQVNASADLITQHLGVAPLTFAYPFNAWNDQVKAVVLERHLFAREQSIELVAENFTLAFANNMVETAIAQQRWVVTCGHGVDGAGWSPISSSILREHLAYLQSRSGDIWVDTVANVARYVREREVASILVQSYTPGNLTFTVQCPGLNSTLYNVPLTLKVSTGSLTATQATAKRGTTALPVTIKPGYLLIEATPGLDPITVTYN